ncbi:hypothetical protein GCM10027405_30430 [Arthrobacter alkaliphilus]|uniref:GIY-YIG nuclease family protein n=1 Tax=Arthrobacter alkaliphilus TaxID=369936 RepID=UPI001F2DD57A|nr:GIY-YIG nuclease family protein [Arthrobacter alkaliphilus]
MARTGSKSAPPVEHFGELARPGRYGHRLTREMYALVNKTSSTQLPREWYTDEQWESLAWAYEDQEHTRLADDYCTRQREAALENFDLNMTFFAQLSMMSFEEALNEMLRKHKGLRPVENLTVVDGQIGVYVMVLDGYRQAYIGQAWDIRKRIKRHWSGTQQFDRLIFPDNATSILPIDSFRALDTTRIFAAKTTRGDDLEPRLVSTFPSDLLLNRVPGGARMLGARFLQGEIKHRQLTPKDISAPFVGEVANAD